jgi:hypothetical protein
LNLTQIVRGEPDATLFAPPAGYTVHQMPMPTATGTVVSGGNSSVTVSTSSQP